MPLTKADGNMYSWVTHCHTHLRGACQHACSYCYVQAMARRFPAMRACYTGPTRIEKSELQVRYGTGKTIFLEHLHDIGSPGVTMEMLTHILNHAEKWPKNQYVIQTKAPWRMVEWMGINFLCELMYQIKPTIGTTIESNRVPESHRRQEAIRKLTDFGFTTFVTIEPILDFDPLEFRNLILHADPMWVNIGADSKGGRLDEPSQSKVRDLIALLKEERWDIRIKQNLSRLYPNNNLP